MVSAKKTKQGFSQNQNEKKKKKKNNHLLAVLHCCNFTQTFSASITVPQKTQKIWFGAYFKSFLL